MSARDLHRTSSRRYASVGPDEATQEKLRDLEGRRVDRAAKRAELRERFARHLPDVDSDEYELDVDTDYDDDSDEYELPPLPPRPEPPPPIEIPPEWRGMDRSIAFDLTGSAADGSGRDCDQFSLFNTVSDMALPHCVLGQAQPRARRFSAAMVAEFRRTHPAKLVNLAFVASDSRLLPQGQLQIVRWSPNGDEATESLFLDSFFTRYNFATTRVQVPIATTSFFFDGFTFARLIFPRHTAANQLAVVASFDR